MAVDLVISNGHLVSAREVVRAGLAIHQGKIVALGEESTLPEASRYLDAKGKYVLPGLVDPHFHLGYLFPFDENTRNETRAALAGGVTTLGVFIPSDPQEGILRSFPETKRVYEENALTDAFFHVFVRDELGLEQIPRCPELGVTSFKFSLGYKGPQTKFASSAALDDGMLFEGFEKIAKLGQPAWGTVHAENIDICLRLRERLIKQGRTDAAAWNDSRPSFCEAECMSRCLFLARVTGCPLYVVHMTIGEGVDMVAEAKAQGIQVVAETCPQYLTHNSEEMIPLLRDNPPLANVNPPLRDKESNNKLWQGISQGVVECIGSDHAAMTLAQKGSTIWDAPMGLGNLSEMILPVMLSEGVNKGRTTLPKLVEVCCTNPARVFGIYPKKGVLAVGSDADLALVDLNKKVKVTADMLHSASDWTIYEGWDFTGWPVATILRGQVAVEEGRILARPGVGRYLPRQLH